MFAQVLAQICDLENRRDEIRRDGGETAAIDARLKELKILKDQLLKKWLFLCFVGWLRISHINWKIAHEKAGVWNDLSEASK